MVVVLFVLVRVVGAVVHRAVPEGLGFLQGGEMGSLGGGHLRGVGQRSVRENYGVGDGAVVPEGL